MLYYISYTRLFKLSVSLRFCQILCSVSQAFSASFFCDTLMMIRIVSAELHSLMFYLLISWQSWPLAHLHLRERTLSHFQRAPAWNRLQPFAAHYYLKSLKQKNRFLHQSIQLPLKVSPRTWASCYRMKRNEFFVCLQINPEAVVTLNNKLAKRQSCHE